MSVPKDKRKPSAMDFLNNAVEISKQTISLCKNHVSKRYTFLIGTSVCDLANDIHYNVMMGNSLNAKYEDEYEMRRKYFLTARASVYALVSRIGIIQEMFNISPNDIEELMRLLNSESNLLKGIIESDERRHKKTDS